MSNLVKFLGAIISITGLMSQSCYQDKTKQGKVVNYDTLHENEILAIQGKSDYETTVNYILPTPDEVLDEILTNQLNLKFELGNINKSSSIEYYLDTKKQALNLGVYLTDLAYINMTGDRNHALEYFKTVRDLSQKLNLYNLFNEGIYNRIQENLNNKDSLSYIFKIMYTDISDILEQTERNNIYIMISSGALIETLYISVKSVKNYKEYKPIVNKIFEQKYLLENFYTNASKYSEDANVRETLKLLEQLKTILENAKISGGRVTLEKKENNYALEGGEKIVVTEQDYNKFKELVYKIRTEIVTSNLL